MVSYHIFLEIQKCDRRAIVIKTTIVPSNVLMIFESPNICPCAGAPFSDATRPPPLGSSSTRGGSVDDRSLALHFCCCLSSRPWPRACSPNCFHQAAAVSSILCVKIRVFPVPHQRASWYRLFLFTVNVRSHASMQRFWWSQSFSCERVAWLSKYAAS